MKPPSYIATQGPLASTFDDFWSVICEQDVGLIVMLTKRHEAGREKCGDYLRSGRYGDIVISVEPNGRELATTEEDDDFFGFAASVAEETYMARRAGEASPQVTLPGRSIVTTMIRLSLVTRPELPARRIRHVQYRNWPDFDVPPAIDELLELVSDCRATGAEVVELNERVQAEYRRTGGHPTDLVGHGQGPVVVHCSAGVGRTGSFIAVDVMTQVLKSMYVDEPEGVEEELVRPVRQGGKWMDIDEQQPLVAEVRRSPLPAFLETDHCDCRSMVPPILQPNPILPLVNEMR